MREGIISGIALLVIVLLGLGCISNSTIEDYQPQALPEGIIEIQSYTCEREDLSPREEAMMEGIVRYTRTAYKSTKISRAQIALLVCEFNTTENAENVMSMSIPLIAYGEQKYRDGRFVIAIRYDSALKYEGVAILDQIKGVKAI